MFSRVTKEIADRYPAADDAEVGNIIRDRERIDQIGEIMIRVYRNSEAIPIMPTLEDTEHESLLDNRATKLHEKSLKGDSKSHSTV